MVILYQAGAQKLSLQLTSYMSSHMEQQKISTMHLLLGKGDSLNALKALNPLEATLDKPSLLVVCRRVDSSV